MYSFLRSKSPIRECHIPFASFLSLYQVKQSGAVRNLYPYINRLTVLSGNLTILDTRTCCFQQFFSIFIPSLETAMFDVKQNKTKKIQEGQHILIKLKSEPEEWKAIQKASMRQVKMHTTDQEQRVYVLLREQKTFFKCRLTAC